MPKAVVPSKATNAKRKTKGKQLCTCSQCSQLNPEGVLVDKASYEKHKNRDMDAAIWHDVNGSVPSSSHGRMSLPSQAGPTLRAASPPSQSSNAAHGAVDSMSEDGDAQYFDMIEDPDVDLLDADAPILLSIDHRTTLVERPESPRQYVGACLPDWVLADCLSLDEPFVNPDARFPGPPDDAACIDSVPGPIVIDTDAHPDASAAQDAPVLRDEDSTTAPSADTLRTPQSLVSDTIESDPPASTMQPPDYLEHPELLKLPRDPPRPYPLPPAPPPPPLRDPGLAAGKYMSSHNQWYIRVFAALCAVMHIQYHVPLLALDLLLVTVHAVFSALHLLPAVPGEPQMNKFTSCRTMISRLGLDDMFTIYPVCPNCCHVAAPSAPEDYICPECGTALYTHRSKLAKLRGAKRIPAKQWAYTPLSRVLSVILSDDAVQEKIEQHMRAVSTEGQYRNTHDGKIMRQLRGPDGKRFFGKRTDKELHIGVTAGVDGFDPFSHSFRDSHSTTAVTWAFCGLDFAERYKHLLLNTLFPGPKEPTCAQLQKYFYLIVNDLLDLYDNGITVYSKKYPEGRLVRVALIALICDHPALCKLCGFSDKRHNMAPCTKCKVTQAEIRTARGVSQGFAPRDGAEHKQRALEWLELSGKKQEQHYEKHGSQWFELARLPYFDPVRMTIIDPMHCLLLGVVKNLWYGVWIKGIKALRPNTESGTKRELDILHTMLHEFEQPSWLGRLPKMVGEPAGGSLSADEWKHIATTFGPVALPAIWYDTQDAANQEQSKALARYDTAVQKHTASKAAFVEQLCDPNAAARAAPDGAVKGSEMAVAQTKRGKKAPALPEPQNEVEWVEQNPVPQLPAQLRRHQDEIPMFLSLSAALRVLFSRSLTDTDVKRGNELLKEHFRRFCELYGDEYLMYNQHWATHIPAQIPDYGPTYGFWAFPGERVNKVLKGVNTNNRRGGEMEITMLRGYQRTTQLSQLLAHAELASTNDAEKQILRRLRTHSQDKRQVRGTVDSIASGVRHSVPGTVSVLCEPETAPHLDEHGEGLDEPPDRTELIEQEGAARHAGFLVLGPPSKPARLKAKTQSQLLKFYSASGAKVHVSSDSRMHDEDSIQLQQFLTHHPYITLDGHRIVPLEQAKGSASSALVKVRRAPEDTTIQPCHGEVLNIFSHSHNGVQRTFATIRAFKDYTPGLMPAHWNWWDAYPEVDVEYWYLDQYDETKVVPVENIVCQLARARFDNPPMWMTVALEKHRIDNVNLAA